MLGVGAIWAKTKVFAGRKIKIYGRIKKAIIFSTELLTISRKARKTEYIAKDHNVPIFSFCHCEFFVSFL